MKIVQCWLEHPVRRLDQTFTYLYDDEDIEVGSRVTIPLLNRSVVGFVESIQDTDERKRLKYDLVLSCALFKMLKITRV